MQRSFVDVQTTGWSPPRMCVSSPKSRQGCLWTQEETNLLTVEWGLVDLEKIANRLGRTPLAVASRAVSLGLGSPSKETKTLQHLVQISGYTYQRILKAAKRAGVLLRRVRRMHPRQDKFTHLYAVTEEQEEAILAYLKSVPDGQRVYSMEGRRTQNGAWGEGLKPKCCFRCGTTEDPHCAIGLCGRCYIRWLRFRKRFQLEYRDLTTARDVLLSLAEVRENGRERVSGRKGKPVHGPMGRVPRRRSR